LGVVNGKSGFVDVATSTFGPSPATATTYSSAATAAALSALNHELPAECGE
jgi:hypothetical protein